MKTYVEFYNDKDDVYIKIPMYYAEIEETLSVDQRCLAYDELSRLISEDFACNSRIFGYENKTDVI